MARVSQFTPAQERLHELEQAWRENEPPAGTLSLVQVRALMELAHAVTEVNLSPPWPSPRRAVNLGRVAHAVTYCEGDLDIDPDQVIRVANEALIDSKDVDRLIDPLVLQYERQFEDRVWMPSICRLLSI